MNDRAAAQYFYDALPHDFELRQNLTIGQMIDWFGAALQYQLKHGGEYNATGYNATDRNPWTWDVSSTPFMSA